MAPLIEELHEQLLIIQRRMRWLRLRTSFHIDPITSNLLPVIATSTSLYSRELCTFLKASPTQISRLLSHLQEQNLISSVRDPKDARLKSLSLSAQGLSALREIYHYDNQLARTGLKAISIEKQNQLAELAKCIADGFSAPRVEKVEEEDLFVAEQKRAARVLGMLGADYLETGFDMHAYQLLYMLFKAKSALRFAEIKEHLGFESSFLSREVDRLVEKGWASKLAQEGDNRRILVDLSTKGRELFRATHSTANKRLEQALIRVPHETLYSLTELLRQANSGQLVEPVSKQIKVKVCKTKKDFFSARENLIEWLVAKRQHRKLSSELLPEKFSTFLVLEEGHCVAIAQARERSKGVWRVENLEVKQQAAISQVSAALKTHMEKMQGVSKVEGI